MIAREKSGFTLLQLPVYPASRRAPVTPDKICTLILDPRGQEGKINSDNISKEGIRKQSAVIKSLHEVAVAQSSSHHLHENLHQSNIIRMKATAPSGAYWRIIALMLIFLAAFLYFSDSDRRDVDRCDIPRRRRQFFSNVY